MGESLWVTRAKQNDLPRTGFAGLAAAERASRGEQPRLSHGYVTMKGVNRLDPDPLYVPEDEQVNYAQYRWQGYVTAMFIIIVVLVILIGGKS